MARIRTIKPEFFLDDELAELSMVARMLFVGLWTLADCEGRLEDRPKRIKAQILPFDDCDVDSALQTLHDKKFIQRYSVNSEKYIVVTNFRKHQRLSGIEAQSRSAIPASESNTEQHESTLEAVEKQYRSNEEAANAQEGKGKEVNPPLPPQPGLAGTKTESASPVGSAGLADFSKFWLAYPKKIGKGDAERKWKTLKPPIAVVLDAVEQQKQCEQWRKDGGQFVPNPATWLHQRRWEDEHSVHPPVGNGAEQRKPEWLAGAI